MHAVRQILQEFSSRNGLRTLILTIYAILVANCYLSGRPDSIFMGMYRLADTPGESNLLINVYALSYMVCGMALPLEQFSRYLVVPDYPVYIRQGRGMAHFARYLAVLVSYCLVFTAVQVGVALVVVPDVDGMHMLSTAICAGFTLLCLLLMVNLGYLMGNRSIGYIGAVGSYALLLTLGPLARWFALGHIGLLPIWIPVILMLLLVLTGVNALAFTRLEII